MQDIPKATPYRDEVTTITPKTHGSWPGSSEKTSDKAGSPGKAK
jgi:hypothetical protein